MVTEVTVGGRSLSVKAILSAALDPKIAPVALGVRIMVSSDSSMSSSVSVLVSVSDVLPACMVICLSISSIALTARTLFVLSL